MAPPLTERSGILYPAPEASAFAEWIGKPLTELPTPAAVLDRSVVQRNCDRLRHATRKLGVGFRPHVKTHKTTEVTRLQLGGGGGGRVVVSTVREAEALEDLVREGLITDILYGLPVPPSSIPRLASLRSRNPGLTLSILVDHPSQLDALAGATATAWNVYIKLDMGYHRAGVVPSSPQFSAVVSAVSTASEAGTIQLAGLYCHAGNSYSANDTASAFRYLAEELATAHSAAEMLPRPNDGLVLSVGATPTALVATASESSSPSADEARARTMIRAIQSGGRYSLELHAGVYTLLDLQQLSTRVLPSPRSLGLADLALTLLAEVVSVYPGRGADGADEALVALGTVGLGREPGTDWPGWASVSSWGFPEGAAGAPSRDSGWIVGRISQEHGVLTKRDRSAPPLRVGQKIRVWPQHACIAASAHGWYYVVDGSDGGQEVVRDVWVRWRGW